MLMLLFLKHACSTIIREKTAISLDPGFYKFPPTQRCLALKSVNTCKYTMLIHTKLWGQFDERNIKNLCKIKCETRLWHTSRWQLNSLLQHCIYLQTTAHLSQSSMFTATTTYYHQKHNRPVIMNDVQLGISNFHFQGLKHLIYRRVERRTVIIHLSYLLSVPL